MKTRTINHSHNTEVKGFDKFYTIGMVLLPILNEYQIISINFIDFFNMAFFVIFVLFRGKISINKTNMCFFPYMVYTLLLSVSALLMYSTSVFIAIKTLISYLLLVLNIYCIGIKHFNLDLGYKVYTKIVMAGSIILIIELLWYMIVGGRIALVLPFATLNYADGMSGSTYISLIQSSASYRASAFFIEPATFASYSLPWLILSLFYSNKKHNFGNIIRSGFVTLAIVLSTSSLGMLGCLIAWVVYIDISLWIAGRKNLLLVIPALLIIGSYVYNLDIIQAQILSKFHSLQDLTRSTSLSNRLMRGWYCFQEFPLVNKILGCGYGSLSNFLTQHRIETILDNGIIVNTYMNGFFLLVCNTGIVGTVLYLWALLKSISWGKYCKMLFMCWLYLQITAQVFDTPLLLLLTLFIICIPKSGSGVLVNK